MLKLNLTGSSQYISTELFAKRYRACASCGEANPSFVKCPSCDTLNGSAHPCRNCGGPGGMPNEPWEKCPTCNANADAVERKLTGWYGNPFRQMAQIWREWAEKKGFIANVLE